MNYNDISARAYGRWNIAIPLIVWLVCLGTGVGKIIQTDSYKDPLTWLDIFNSNTFSAYISMISCMIYQFFSEENYGKREKSGLSRKNMWITITGTITYSVITLINVVRYNMCTSIICLVFSVLYVLLFFKYMRSKG